jgi:hypothetical protein
VFEKITAGRESAPFLSGGRGAAGDASGDGVDGRPTDHGLGYGGVAFVVAGQPVSQAKVRSTA